MVSVLDWSSVDVLKLVDRGWTHSPIIPLSSSLSKVESGARRSTLTPLPVAQSGGNLNGSSITLHSIRCLHSLRNKWDTHSEGNKCRKVETYLSTGFRSAIPATLFWPPPPLLPQPYRNKTKTNAHSQTEWGWEMYGWNSPIGSDVKQVGGREQEKIKAWLFSLHIQKLIEQLGSTSAKRPSEAALRECWMCLLVEAQA